MKKLIKYVVSFLFVFLLFPVTVIADEVTDPQEPKTYEVTCGIDIYSSLVYVKSTRVIGSISLDDFASTGNIGIEALVDGNGNQARFSNQIEYKKIGNRIELNLDNYIPTNVNEEQFQEHFGLFPEITCTAG